MTFAVVGHERCFRAKVLGHFLGPHIRRSRVVLSADNQNRTRAGVGKRRWVRGLWHPGTAASKALGSCVKAKVRAGGTNLSGRGLLVCRSLSDQTRRAAYDTKRRADTVIGTVVLAAGLGVGKGQEHRPVAILGSL